MAAPTPFIVDLEGGAEQELHTIQMFVYLNYVPLSMKCIYFWSSSSDKYIWLVRYIIA